MRKSGTGRSPILSDAEAGKLFEELVNGVAQGAGERAAFMSLVEVRIAQARNGRLSVRRL